MISRFQDKCIQDLELSVNIGTLEYTRNDPKMKSKYETCKIPCICTHWDTKSNIFIHLAL